MSQILLFNRDCMDVMRHMPDNGYELSISDPPYFDGPNKLGYYGDRTSSVGVKRGWQKLCHWEIPDQRFKDSTCRVSRNQIIWGANYYDFIEKPHTTPRRKNLQAWIDSHPIGWIVWDKVNDNSTFNDFELAWTSFDIPTQIFAFMWNGMLQGKSITEGHIHQGNKRLNEKRIHPTQKPVTLYKWLLKNYAKPGDRILDTHLGSGSIAIACHDMGFDLTAYEIDTDYYEAAMKRFNNHKAQLQLFH